MQMDAIHDYVAAHEQAALDELTRYCAQPSVSAEGQGLDAMAALVAASLEERGFHVEIVPMPTGAPVVYAELLDRAPPDAPTLLIYNHYDVQPAGEPAFWTSPPFEPTIRDGKFYARGAADTKGNIVSRLAAIDALLAVTGEMPVHLKWIIEGEEETGSGALDLFLRDYRERLAADACLWEFGTFTWDGTPQVMLGLKGMVTVELSVVGPRHDLHSSLAAYVAGPAWRLVWALGTLKDENEYVQIDGFYDSMRAPTATELELVRGLPDDSDALLADLGLEQFAMGLTGFHRRVAEIFSPTCNIEGLWSGYQGPGSKTILPCEATAKLDFRLVPDQDPDEIVRLLRAHLDDKGFSDVLVRQIDTNLYPARTEPEHPFVQMACAACAELVLRPPVVYPSSPASGPMYPFTHDLGLPVVAVGCGYPGSATHAPDENIRLSDFRAGTQLIAMLLTRMRTVDFAGAARVAAITEGRATQPLETGLDDVDEDALAALMAGDDEPAPAPPSGTGVVHHRPRRK